MKFIKYLFFILFISTYNFVFSANIPVENLFSDIEKDYKYYDQLQDLSNRQALYPDSDWKFNPYSLLSRDEFVWITLEVSCKKCTKPNTSIDIISKYSKSFPYFDVTSSNNFSYCVALSADKNYIDSYTVWHKCDNLTYNAQKTPFCPNNYVSLEEAISVILRNSNIFTKEDNNNVIQKINNWEITESLAKDFNAKNTDWTANQYYGYIKKALEYEIVEYDNLWNQKIYKLLELTDWNIYPKKLITKEDFLKMAYISLKTNSCNNIQTNNLALKIEIVDSTCNSYESNCSLALITQDQSLFDFKWFSTWSCNEWIDEVNWYIWKFYNQVTWDEIIKYWKYINDFTFLSEWNRYIYLSVVDKCNNSWEVYNSLYLSKNGLSNKLSVSIDLNTISWYTPLPISFYSIVGWWNWSYTYVWNFWNNEKWNWKNIDYVYNESWIFNVSLTVTDSDWNIWTASILVKSSIWWNCEDQDSDTDWINDCKDLCPLVYWKSSNSWCPVLTPCNNDCSCPPWKVCSTNNESLCWISWVCELDDTFNDNEVNNLTNDCLEKQDQNKIYWNVICNTCPCLNFIDFNSTLRKCDYVFPAITSSWNTDIYSVWDSYEVY